MMMIGGPQSSPRGRGEKGGCRRTLGWGEELGWPMQGGGTGKVGQREIGCCCCGLSKRGGEFEPKWLFHFPFPFLFS